MKREIKFSDRGLVLLETDGKKYKAVILTFEELEGMTVDEAIVELSRRMRDNK